MARPQKEGLDYFPLDVDIDQDDKLLVPIAKYGMEGFGIVIKLMTEVYKNGYYYPWTEKEQYIFSSKINVDYDRVMAIVNECIKWGFFNQELYEMYSILTSRGFQKRFLLASNRRKDAKIQDDYLLDKVAETAQKRVNVDINPVIAGLLHTETPELSAISTQSKVKESKVNKTKVNKDIVAYADIVDHLNMRASTSYKPTTKRTHDLIKARYNDGFTLEDFKVVIDKKCAEWKNTEQEKYLRPETLFGNKFEGYLNQSSNSLSKLGGNYTSKTGKKSEILNDIFWGDEEDEQKRSSGSNEVNNQLLPKF